MLEALHCFGNIAAPECEKGFRFQRKCQPIKVHLYSLGASQSNCTWEEVNGRPKRGKGDYGSVQISYDQTFCSHSGTNVRNKDWREVAEILDDSGVYCTCVVVDAGCFSTFDDN